MKETDHSESRHARVRSIRGAEIIDEPRPVELVDLSVSPDVAPDLMRGRLLAYVDVELPAGATIHRGTRDFVKRHLDGRNPVVFVEAGFLRTGFAVEDHGATTMGRVGLFADQLSELFQTRAVYVNPVTLPGGDRRADHLTPIGVSYQKRSQVKGRSGQTRKGVPVSANLQSRDPKPFSSAIDLLRDIQSAPRQFRERFLDQEGLDHVSFQTVSTLGQVELERFAFRWKAVGAAPAFPKMEASAMLSHERPEFLDDQSAAEMMRGMYEE